MLAAALAVAVGACAGEDPEALRARARQELESGQFEKAEGTAEALAAAVAEPAPADRLLRGRIARALGRDDEALRELALVPERDPAAAEARLNEGQIEVRRGRLRFAEAAFLRALERDPTLVQARRELVYVYGMQLRRRALAEQFLALSKLGPLTSQQVWLWSMSADLIWWEPKENERELLEFLEKDPEDRWTRLALAEDYRRLGEVSKARALLDALPEDDVEARAMRALLAVEGGDFDRAAALIEGGPPDDPALARLKGRIALARRETDTALEALRTAYAGEPWRRDAASALGSAYRLAGDEEQAKRYLDAAQKLDALGGLLLKLQTAQGQKDPNLLRELGAACEAVGRPEEARAWYRLAITRDPLDKAAQLALHRLDTAGPDSNGDFPNPNAL